jgi:hypothetical protein
MVAKITKKNKSLCIDAKINSDKYPILIGSNLFEEIPELFSKKNVGKQVLIIADSFSTRSPIDHIFNLIFYTVNYIIILLIM